jgi:O-antigen/teichoic acid export membrane protein
MLKKFPFISKRLDGHMIEVIKKAAVALFMRVLGAGLAFGFNVLIARALGAEGSGMYFLALTVTTIATVFGRLGMDNTLLRFVAAHASIGEWVAVKGVYQKGMLLSLTASGISTLVVFLSAPWLAQTVFSKPELTEPIRWMSLAIIPTALGNLQAQVLKGLKRILASSFIEIVSLSALSVGIFYLLGPDWQVNDAVWAYGLAAGITALMGVWLWWSATPQTRGIQGYFDTQELLRTSLPLFWVASINLVMMWTATLLLGVWGTTEDVGVFGVASRTANLTNFILVAVNSIAAPKFAAFYKQGQMRALGSMARNSSTLMMLWALPILVLFVAAPGWVMKVFGQEFVGGGPILAILTIGQFVNVATGSVGFLLMMTGHEKLARNNIAASAVANVVLNVTLIPLYGVVGAAIATAISLAGLNLMAAYLVWKHLHIWTIPFTQRFVRPPAPPPNNE